MRILIAGGRGFLGDALRRALRAAGHDVVILTRGRCAGTDEIPWDGRHTGAWTRILSTTDAVVNASGYGLEHWPWSRERKRQFLESRVKPGRLLARAIAESSRRPGIFIQFSGINRYGLVGTAVADEDTPAADDFLARLTVEWEASTTPLADIGVRHVVVRNAVVLDAKRGLFPLTSLPSRLYAGGRFGSGQQCLAWIHRDDHVMAVKRLLEDEAATGAYNLVAPTPTTNAEFMEAVCKRLRRPYWLRVPAFALRLVLGEMAVLVLDGRPSKPRRLLEMGFEFTFPNIGAALQDLFGRPSNSAPFADGTPT